MKNCVEKIFGGLRGSYFSYALTYFSFYFGMGAFISVQSVYLMGLGKSTGEMSFIVSASSLFGIVLIPAVGYLNDRLKKPRLHRRSAWHPHDVFPAGRALGAGAAPQPFPARAECKKSVFLSVSSAVCAAEIEKQHKKEEN